MPLQGDKFANKLTQGAALGYELLGFRACCLRALPLGYELLGFRACCFVPFRAYYLL